MIRNLYIEGYRGFSKFEMHDLGRVNLLVGPNNCGKTSILEAILLLASQADPWTLWEILNRRGERTNEDGDRPTQETGVEVRHLFSKHRLSTHSRFLVRGRNAQTEQSVSCTVCENEERDVLFPEKDALGATLAFLVEVNGVRQPVLPLTRNDMLTRDLLWRRRSGQLPNVEAVSVQFVSADSLGPESAGKLWQRVALTPEEELVVQALRVLEPAIERIAFIGTSPGLRHRQRGGFIVKCTGERDPIPIGSLGDGIWRILVLVLTAIWSRDGVFLVDEIDTGLHHSVMDDMWKTVKAIAERANVQVFATTHSQDCVQSLATICREDVSAGSEVTIQRIEPQRQRAVALSEREITIAAQRNIEVR